MDILKRVRQAQQQLRSTQINWQEACLFNCDEMLSDIIRELEAAEQSVQADGAICKFCKKPMLGNNHVICGAVAKSPRR